MSNLIPIHAERDLSRLYMHRLLSVASVFLLAGAIVAGIILLPSYVIVKKNQTSVGLSATSSANAASVADRALVARIQSRVDALSPFVGAASTPSELIETVLAPRPAGASVNHVTFNGGKTFTILLSGASASADKVAAYQASLAKNPRFSGVSVPIGSLAGTNDGRFNITIVGAF